MKGLKSLGSHEAADTILGERHEMVAGEDLIHSGSDKERKGGDATSMLKILSPFEDLALLENRLRD